MSIDIQTKSTLVKIAAISGALVKNAGMLGNLASRLERALTRTKLLDLQKLHQHPEYIKYLTTPVNDPKSKVKALEGLMTNFAKDPKINMDQNVASFLAKELENMKSLEAAGKSSLGNAGAKFMDYAAANPGKALSGTLMGGYVGKEIGKGMKDEKSKSMFSL